MLFSTVGYRFVFAMLDNIAIQKQDARIDACDYNETGLIEIKVPLNMPYQQRFTAFERHYGQITVDGKVYTYVKMKVDDNMLILKCLPDFNRQQIKNSEDNLAKANSSQDMDNTGKKHNAFFSKMVISDYDHTNQLYDLRQNALIFKINRIDFTTPVLTAFITPLHQPPRC